jgi:uncharacterized protein YndB with AHSA1/START domain
MADQTEDVGTVERSEQFAVPPDTLWQAITDPDLLEEWFGPVDFDLTAGGAITEPDSSGSPRPIGVVETVDEPRRIGFVWIAPGSETPSSVDLVIDDDGRDGSVLHVRETLIQPQWEPRPAWFASSRRASARV